MTVDAVEPVPYQKTVPIKGGDEVVVLVIPRRVFARDYWRYKPGEHVAFGGPTQRGKTTLAFDLLEYTATPELPAYVSVSKPDDNTSSKRGAQLEFRRVSEWPPPPSFNELVMREKPRGYLVWPEFGDMDKDVVRASNVTRSLLMERYAAGARGKKKAKGILVMDDTMIKAKVLGLDREMTTILAMAGAMGIGLWTFVQKPTDSGRTAVWAYSQSEHIFIAKDKDTRSVMRYDEIGGQDPRLIASILPTLGPFQFVYVKATEGYLCIVDAD